MSAFFWFVIGFLVGGIVGIVLLSLLIANDHTEWDDD